VIVAKAIKPARFKSEAFTKAITAAANEAAKQIEKDFEATTKTWKHKPKFVKEVDVRTSPVQVLVGTDDEIYRYVDEGTKPHPIFAGIYTGKSNKKALAFQWGGPGSYRAKTSPGVIGSKAGGPTGPMVAFPFVQHPGTNPRNFDETIQKKWEPRFKRLMEQAMSAGARGSGHSI
jgi:hypothetical protein